MTDEEVATEMSDQEAIMKIAMAMKDNAPVVDEKQNVHTFLVNVIKEDAVMNVAKLGNLRDDKDVNELGRPIWTLRGSLEMARMSDMLMSNKFFSDYFNAATIETNASSLSSSGFLVRQATTQTKQVSDSTKRKRINKGWIKSSTEQSGGDITGSAGSN